MKRRTKRFLANIFLLLITLIVFFCIFELAVRFFFPQSLLIEKYDPKLGISLKPNLDVMQYNEQLERIFSYHVVTNSQGLREKEGIALQKEGKSRILFFGDSFVFGKGVNQEETVPYVLDQMIGDPNVKIINFGVPGVNVDYYYLRLIEDGLKFEPDVVIFGVFAGNDFSSQGTFFTIKEGLLKFKNGDLKYNPPKKESKFTFFTASYLHSPRFMVLLLDGNPATRWIINLLGLSRAKKMPLFTDSQEEYEMYKKINFEVLKLTQEFSKKEGFEFVVFLFPSKEQVDDDAYTSYVKNSGIDEVIDRYEIQKDLSEFMKGQNIYYKDLTEDFIEEHEKQQIYYLREIHWNAKGNSFAAKKVYEELTKLDILSA